jgi:hypothetical protein
MREEYAFTEELQLLLVEVLKKLGVLVPSRIASTLMALLSLDGCGPRRPHADYTCESLDGIVDDGFCGGLPPGVVVALQMMTFFDMCGSEWLG